MNIEMLKKSGYIIFDAISGSHSYGTNIETSDVDTRGIFRMPKEAYLSFKDIVQEVSNESEDIKYFELRKFLKLASECNPNIIELLFLPEDCITYKTPAMDKLLENRNLFISKKAYHTFSGYAYSQISKATGANKMVNHPELFTKPVKEDFCWIIPECTFNTDFLKMQPSVKMPARPISIKEIDGLDLSKYHVAALEHVPNTYRLYYYGDSAKGVFRGDDMLVCESIPMDDELDKFIGLLIYNKHEYEKALAQNRKYNDWIANRNEARWVDQEKGLLAYDQKNMMHCVRLLWSGKNILTNGEPIVRFKGEQLNYLMSIRRGELKYDTLIELVEKEMLELKEIVDKSCNLQWGCNINKLDELYKELVEL